MAATAAAVSPSSSPRLPSPPPFPEVQIGPQSPTVVDTTAGDKLFAPLPETDDGSTRRIRPGTKAADMAAGLPLIPLSQLDSPFQLQEHLKALYHNYTMPPDSDTTQPITREVAVSLANPPEGVERSLWLYELCRFLTMKVNNLIIAFFAENPPCSAESCPEMRASEWQYLCAVHDPPKPCCAIDYCCHTIDWATNILTSPKYFPSRLTLGSDAAGGAQASMRYLTNIFRRLYRIFAHAWFQHRDVFRQVENTDGLYVFFKTVCDVYELIPEPNYTIPADAEQTDQGSEADASAVSAPLPSSSSAGVIVPGDNRRISVLRKDHNNTPQPHLAVETGESQTPAKALAAATTRRHKHSPSTGSSVATIAETVEESGDSVIKAPALSKVEENTEADSKPAAESEVVAETTQAADSPNEQSAQREAEEKAAQLEADASSALSPVESETVLPNTLESTKTNEETEAPAKETTASETGTDAPAVSSSTPEASAAEVQTTDESSKAPADTSTTVSVEEKAAEDDE